MRIQADPDQKQYNYSFTRLLLSPYAISGNPPPPLHREGYIDPCRWVRSTSLNTVIAGICTATASNRHCKVQQNRLQSVSDRFGELFARLQSIKQRPLVAPGRECWHTARHQIQGKRAITNVLFVGLSSTKISIFYQSKVLNLCEV
jgi:hypothetical protein